MATHSNTLVWKMLWTEEPDRLQSMGSERKELHKTGQLHINTTFNTNWVKNLPTEQETQVQSLGWEDPLEGEIATHSSISAWRSPWTEKPGGLQSKGSQRVGHDSALHARTYN